MPLDQSQLVTFGNHIRANTDQAVIDALAAGALNAIAAWYNQDAAPDFFVFRTSVSTDDARKAIDYSEVLSDTTPLGDVERWAFDNMLANGDFDPTVENNRDALVAIFNGSDYPNTRAALLAESVRLATEAEKIFAVTATGPAGGNGSNATNAAALVVDGDVTVSDVDLALEATA